MAYAPAKLIITGEYAVMHGKPALALPLNSSLSIQAVWQSVPSINKKNESLIDLTATFNNNTQHWQSDFRQTRQSYADMVKKQANFVSSDRSTATTYTISTKKFIDCVIFLSIYSTIAQSTNHQYATDGHYSLTIDSNIPLGSGLGSSAATAVAILRAIQPKLSEAQYFHLACQSEDFVHGKSGLLDPWIAVYNKACYWQQGKAEPIECPPIHYLLIHTGVPECSTAHCVQQVSQNFPDTDRVWQDMGDISMAIAQYTQHQQLPSDSSGMETLIELIKKNHRLLCQLGVVPRRVRHFIAEIESLGCGAKTTGAGAVTGEKGGVVMVLYPANTSLVLKQLLTLVKHYGYTLIPLNSKPNKI